MTDAVDLIASRRSVPALALKPPAPEGAELERLLTLASRVPDHGKLVPWRFIVLRGEACAVLNARAAALAAADDPAIDEIRLKKERARFPAPLTVAVVCRAAPHVKIPEWEQELAVGAVCMNLIASARAFGYAANWLTGWIAYDRRFMDELGLAPHERIAGFVHLGTSDMKIEDRARPDIAAITTVWQPATQAAAAE